jgi:hypothetical protein
MVRSNEKLDSHHLPLKSCEKMLKGNDAKRAAAACSKQSRARKQADI